MIEKPQSHEHSDYYAPYLALVTEDELVQALENQIEEFLAQLGAITEDQAGIVHPPYSWTIKQVVGHMIDSERVFGYRVMRFAAGDSAPCQGFDQDAYVANSDFSQVKLNELAQELESLRRGNIAMVKRFSPASLDNQGTTDGNMISVRSIICLLVGHVRHHLNIICDRLARSN